MVRSSVGCAHRSKNPLPSWKLRSPCAEMFLSTQSGSVLRSATSTPKSTLATILGHISMALVLEPGNEQRTLLACVILGTLIASCMVAGFLVQTAHRLIHRKDVRDDEIEPRSGEVIHA